jgi:hypothetical protein
MSYAAFKFEVISQLYPPHSDTVRQAQVIGTAYNNLVLRHFDTLSGGGQYLLGSARLPVLISGLQAIFALNRASGFSAVNIFRQIGPLLKAYWAGATIIGPLGVTVVSSPGNVFGPVIPQTTNYTVFLNIFCGVLYAHMLTLAGTFTSYWFGRTTPWGGALLLSTP